MAEEMGAKYNGWSNYPTWVCNLWLTNDEPTYNMARSMLGPEALKEWVADTFFDDGITEGTMLKDMANWVFAWIDFQEIFDSLHEP